MVQCFLKRNVHRNKISGIISLQGKLSFDFGEKNGDKFILTFRSIFSQSDKSPATQQGSQFPVRTALWHRSAHAHGTIVPIIADRGTIGQEVHTAQDRLLKRVRRNGGDVTTMCNTSTCIYHYVIM